LIEIVDEPDAELLEDGKDDLWRKVLGALADDPGHLLVAYGFGFIFHNSMSPYE